MGDRVFIADYIKKKRRRKGNIEYLVKWKGYPTRHCTWEPQENILDNSLIRQFDEEGYDPRRVRAACRAACRKKKRRRSEITEARSLSLPFSDSDSDHERSSLDVLGKHQNKVTPVSLSKYGGVWKTDATHEKLDTLFEKDSETATEQKKRDNGGNIVDNKENAFGMNESFEKDCNSGTLHKNGGKSCHPKMRAKFMFRSGDFENVDWGSCNDWTSSDNESMRGTENKEVTQEIYGLTFSESYKNPAKRRRLSTFSLDVSSTASESTIPAIEELDSPMTHGHGLNIDMHTFSPSTLSIGNPSLPEYEYSRPNSCPYLESSDTPQTCDPVVEDTSSMPVLTNESIVEPDEPDEPETLTPFTQTTTPPGSPTQTLHEQTKTESVESLKPVADEVKTRDNVFVTEVTLENLTVIIQECERTKGFFRWEN